MIPRNGAVKNNMALLHKLFPSKKFSRSTARKLSTAEIRNDWKKPQFNDKAIRLVIFTDNDIKGRKLIFDSKGIVKEEEQSSWSRCREKLSSMQQGGCQAKKPNQPIYMPKRTGSDGKMLEEIMFGAVGVAYKGTSLKVHVIRSPPQLMLTKVFVPDKPKHSSVSDLDDSCSLSSQNDLTGTGSRQISQDSKGSPNIAKSIPVDVPSPHTNWMRSIDMIDEDSGLASLTSSGSFQTPGSNAGSCNSFSLERRLIRGMHMSLESFSRRKSQHDLLQSQENGAPARPKKNKIAMCILFGTIDETNEEANRLFENFFFSHIALFESHLERLRLDIERGYNTGKYSSFITIVIEALGCFKQEIVDLYVAPRLSEPVWLNMMSYSNYRYVLCEKFLQEFMSLVVKWENKNTNFFISTLVTAVLTHHLAWVPTVTPAGGTPSRTYVDKHSAKWVDTLAKQHPYNPLWAQLSDLYGAIGFPLKLSRTIVVGKRAELVKKLLYVLSYFIRCSDILQISEWGCLRSSLEAATFAETPGDVDRGFVPETPTPTQQPEENSGGSSVCYNRSESNKTLTQRASGVSTDEMDTSKSEGDLCSDKLDCPERDSENCQSCEMCAANRKLDMSENRYGKSVFYVPNVCYCDRPKVPSAKANTVERTNFDTGGGSVELQSIPSAKARQNLKLDIPSLESRDNNNCDYDSLGPQLSECRLSFADIVEDTKRCSTQHVQRDVDTSRVASPIHIGSSVVKSNTNEGQPKNSASSKLSQMMSPSDGKERILSKSEIQALFLKEPSTSEFNEYYEDGIEAKTIDDIDEKDRVVDLPVQSKNRYLSGDSQKLVSESASKAPSLPDLTQVKGDSKLPRERLGSLDHTKVRSRKTSFSRQVSETGSSRPNLAPIRCRPVTPTELNRRRHLSSTGSIDFDFLDPRSFCKELPMPDFDEDVTCSSQKSFDKNFGRSLLADYSDHYLSDFVLHGTSDRNYMDKLIRDTQMATQYSVLDEPIAEAVCVIADTDNWRVSVCSSQQLEKTAQGVKPVKPCECSPLVSNLVESVHHLWKLKMSPEFCIMHLEDRLQEIFFKSKMLAEYLKGTKAYDVKELSAIFQFESSDLPLLAAIAGTHSPHLSLCVV